MSTLESSGAANEGDEHTDTNDAIHLYIPPRYLILTGTTALTGLSLGLMRGGRQASLQYLAENAHRQPRTVEGWYFYKKTKNYRVMWGALKGGGREALRLGAVGLLWAGLEDGVARAGERVGGRGGEWMGKGKEVGAGVASGCVLAAICEPAVHDDDDGSADCLLFCCADRLPRVLAVRAVFVGGGIGVLLGVLRVAQREIGPGRVDS